MAMKKLSVELRSILSSSLQINNVTRVVEELVYNSLDAKATSIAIRVDLEENKIQVVDNGCGITENDFDLIGQKYSTSKCVDLNSLKSVPNTYGFRGQFLANLINIARKVKVTSRYDKGEDTWVKIFYEGKERDLARTTTRPSVGTTVEVSGLFYNLHIQRKKVESLNELNEIKLLLKQLSLIHSNISISLRDDSNNEIAFKAHKNRNVYQTFGMLFNINEKDIQEYKVEKKEYKVTAYFAKKDKDIGQNHWIYLNGKFTNNCKLHKIVNDALSKSLKPSLKRKVKSKVDYNEDVFTKRNLPFYVILISCPYYDYDISDLTKHTTLEFRNWQAVTDLLKKLILFYTGEDKFNKNLKCKETIATNLKPKVSDEDMRIQVRKIVEKLLRSSSRKVGVSQMQNGIKGKLTKRKKNKKDNALKLSLSKVIPSKNELRRKLSKDISKSSGLTDEVHPIAIPEVDYFKHLQDKDERIKDDRNKHQIIAKQSPDTKEKFEQKINQERYKYKNTNLHDSGQPTDMLISKKMKSKGRKSNIIQNNNYDLHTNKDKHEERKNALENTINSDFNKSMDKSKFTNKYNAELKHNFTINNHVVTDMPDCFYEKENQMKGNNITTICNLTNSNTKVTLRKKVEEIIVYDYVPHPLNSNQCCHLHENRLKKKSHVSSRDLIKTILSTQHNISAHMPIDFSDEDKYKQQQLGILSKSKDILNTEVQQDKIENVAKNTQSSTFDAWNFNFQPDPNFTNERRNESKQESGCLSKMTYESHHYNKNICYDKIDTKGIKRTKKFITKKSEDNFFISIEKQKNNWHKKFASHNSKYLYKSKVTKNHDINSTLGIKNFFKTNNFIPGSSITIEFSNSTENNNLRKTKYQNNIINTNFNKCSLNSGTNQDPIDKNSVNSNNKNTYTIAETSLDARYDCNILSQNYECTRYTNNNLMYETYTIETNNQQCLFNCTNDNNEKHYTGNTQEKQNELNIVFISEPQMDEAESSSDKIVEPIRICETVFNDSHHSTLSASFESLTHMENVVNEINNDIIELADKHNTLSPNTSLRAISHHFNTTNGNINDKAAANESFIPNMDFNSQNNVTNNIILINNTTINNNFKNQAIYLSETSYLMNQNLPYGDIVNTYSIKNRPRFMPKGMSQIFENCNTKGVCDYKFKEEYFEYSIYKDFTKEVQINAEIFKPGIQNAAEDTTKAIEKVHTKLHKNNSSLIFDGKLLKEAQILGQVDNKFIAAVIKAKSEASDYLVLFDQHAVHERIRLEKNLADYFNQQKWKKVKLDDFLLKLSKDEILYLHNYKEKFAQLGLEWNILSDCEVSVFGIPEAILGKNPRQADKVMAAVKNLVLEGISSIKSQGGCISLHPKSIMDLVFSEACRYAIKFGDKLNITECRELIQSLSECKTPFQCAHGRPVMAVLMEMTSQCVRDYKVNMSKIRLFSVK